LNPDNKKGNAELASVKASKINMRSSAHVRKKKTCANDEAPSRPSPPRPNSQGILVGSLGGEEARCAAPLTSL